MSKHSEVRNCGPSKPALTHEPLKLLRTSDQQRLLTGKRDRALLLIVWEAAGTFAFELLQCSLLPQRPNPKSPHCSLEFHKEFAIEYPQQRTIEMFTKLFWKIERLPKTNGEAPCT